MTTKNCLKCLLNKAVYDFKKMTTSRDGYQSYCKTCSGEVFQRWRLNNRARYNEYFRNRTATNLQHRITKNIHAKLNKILKRGHYSARTEQILGCNKRIFLDWLVFQFESEMCFANYGTVWHFDLVNPASNFDLTSEEGLLACFNWKNLRPCLKKDNASKYNFVLAFHIANQSVRVLAFERIFNFK